MQNFRLKSSPVPMLTWSARNFSFHWPKITLANELTACRKHYQFCCRQFITSMKPFIYRATDAKGKLFRTSWAANWSLYVSSTSSSGRRMCTVTNNTRICWNCKKKIGAEIFFCEICKILQPPLTELSFFEILESPETFDVDVKGLTNRYRELQAMIHPDRFGNSKEEEQQYSLEQSSLINKAYNMLLDPLSRAVYLLSLKNISIGEQNTVEGTEFLMAVMEINEKLSEVKSVKDLNEIRSMNNDSIDHCIENISTTFAARDFTAAKEWTIKLRYYRNILEVINEKTMLLDQ